MYEEYETNWWRRFTSEEFEAERKIREDKGYGFFRTFESDSDLGETVHLTQKPLKDPRPDKCIIAGHCFDRLSIDCSVCPVKMQCGTWSLAD